MKKILLSLSLNGCSLQTDIADLAVTVFDEKSTKYFMSLSAIQILSLLTFAIKEVK